MKCMSCNENISAKFTHSIKTNICAFCGGEIIPAALQNILVNFQVLMKDGEPYMEQIEEWFASNYSLRKHNIQNVQKDFVSSQSSGGIFDDENFDEETLRRQTELAKNTASFQQRAGIKNNGMKSIVDQIRGGEGAADPSEFVGVDPDYGVIDMSKEEAGAPLSQKDALAMMQAMNQNNISASNDPVKDYYEIEKLKKLQKPKPSGQGKFSRGE